MKTALNPLPGVLLAVLLALTLCLTAPLALGHSNQPIPDCAAPSRPANDQDDRLWQRFLDDVDAFRACVSAFADANRQSARLHEQAANDAVAAWNAFVKDSLNVPEDFPFEPEAGGTD